MVFLHCASRHVRQGTPFAGSVYFICHIGGFSPPYEQFLFGA